MIRGVNRGMALLLELAVIVATGYWGFRRQWVPLRRVAGLAPPLMMAVLWGPLAAPRATFPLHGAVDAGFRIAWFGVGALAFWAAGHPVAALVLTGVLAVNALMPTVLV